VSIRGRKAIRLGAGLIFAVAGIGKLLLPLIARAHPEIPTFADVLAAIHVPHPVLAGIAICVLEILGAMALFFGRLIRPACAWLAADMIGAMVTLSVPATFFGKAVVARGLTLGNELWRVPLEATLLAALLWLAASERKRAFRRL
jgi:uncharacterized membrane protein YphA (DoxX/SURF4 family)